MSSSPWHKKAPHSPRLSGGAGGSTRAPKRRSAWDDHDINKPSGRRGLRDLAATLTDLADVTAMRDSVRKRAGAIWPREDDWPITVEQALEALDEREKALAPAPRATAGNKPVPADPGRSQAVRHIPSGRETQPDPAQSQTPWNVDDLASPHGLTRLGEVADGLASTADLDTMRGAVRAKARELYGASSDWPPPVQSLLNDMWTRRHAVALRERAKPALTKTKGEVRRIIADIVVQPRNSDSSETWTIRDLETGAGRDRLLTVVQQLPTAEDARAMRKQVWDDARRTYGPVSTWSVAVYQRVSDIRDAIVDRQLAIEAAARSRAEVDRSSRPEPPAHPTASNLTKDWTFNVKKPEDVGQMLALLPELSTRDEIEAMADYVERNALLAWNKPLETWSPAAQALMKAIVDREIAVEPTRAPASWADLSRFAQELPRRRGYRPPHTMVDHLRQRLGDQQRGLRPAVRVRRQVGDTVELVEVGPDNYDRVLQAAQNRSWTDLTDADRQTWDNLTRAWTPVDCPPELLEARAQRWITRTRAMRSESTTTTMPTDEEINSVVKSVIAELSAWIEPEVLDEIGLPKIIVHPPNAEALSGLPAYYDAVRREIHIGSDTWTEKQLRHEFGHHVEEHGPAEVWCGMTAFLGWLSDGKPLLPPREFATRQPTYGVNSDTRQLNLPSSGYALSYYDDAATELVALGLEHRLPDQPDVQVNWKDEIASDRDPRYMAILLQAVRPEMLRKAGVPVPMLL